MSRAARRRLLPRNEVGALFELARKFRKWSSPQTAAPFQQDRELRKAEISPSRAICAKDCAKDFALDKELAPDEDSELTWES